MNVSLAAPIGPFIVVTIVLPIAHVTRLDISSADATAVIDKSIYVSWPPSRSAYASSRKQREGKIEREREREAAGLFVSFATPN